MRLLQQFAAGTLTWEQAYPVALTSRIMRLRPEPPICAACPRLGAGVTVELHLFPGTFHGSMLVQDASISRREAQEAIVVLRNMFGR